MNNVNGIMKYLTATKLLIMLGKFPSDVRTILKAPSSWDALYLWSCCFRGSIPFLGTACEDALPCLSLLSSSFPTPSASVCKSSCILMNLGFIN